MRPKVSDKERRTIMLGVKVNPITKKQVEYMAKAQAEPVSTFIYNLIQAEIDKYTKITKIDWSKEFGEEGGA